MWWTGQKNVFAMRELAGAASKLLICFNDNDNEYICAMMSDFTNVFDRN